MKVLISSAALNIILWGLAFFLFPHGSPATILHYTAVIGVDFIGGSRLIYVLPLLGAVIILMNSALGFAMENSSRRAAWILKSTTLSIQCILFLALIVLWQLNR